MGIVALSVSTSANSSPARTLSPSFLCHLTTVPSVMVSESWGMVICAGMRTSRRETMRRSGVAHLANGGDHFFDAGLHGQLEIMVVGDRNVFAAHAGDGGIQIIENFFVNPFHHTRADAAIAPVFIDDDTAMGFANRLSDRFLIERAQCAQIDHFGVDPVLLL